MRRTPPLRKPAVAAIAAGLRVGRPPAMHRRRPYRLPRRLEPSPPALPSTGAAGPPSVGPPPSPAGAVQHRRSAVHQRWWCRQPSATAATITAAFIVTRARSVCGYSHVRECEPAVL